MIDAITFSIALVIYVIITWQSLLESLEVTAETSMLKIPHAPFHWVLVVGFALFCLSILVLLIETITRRVHQDES